MDGDGRVGRYVAIWGRFSLAFNDLGWVFITFVDLVSISIDLFAIWDRFSLALIDLGSLFITLVYFFLEATSDFEL